LGLAVVEGRTLVETRTTNARDTAIRLIGDMSERGRLNHYPSANDGGGLISISSYANAMSPADAFKSPDATPPSNSNCGTPTNATSNIYSCSAQNQAAYDVWYWRTEIANTLPGGVAYITQVQNSRQLQVVIAWRLNENTNVTLSGITANPQVAAAYQQLATPLQITDLNNGGSTNPCKPADAAQVQQTPAYICHVDFIDIPDGN
jgi:uncharacterized protein YeaC (DUF1315 family)